MAVEGTLGWTVGINTHYASGGSINHDALARLAEAGVRFIRNDVNWESVEKEVGVYDFAGAGFDELVDSCERLGLRILFILDYGNALYGEDRAVVDEGTAAAAMLGRSGTSPTLTSFGAAPMEGLTRSSTRSSSVPLRLPCAPPIRRATSWSALCFSDSTRSPIR